MPSCPTEVHTNTSGRSGLLNPAKTRSRERSSLPPATSATNCWSLKRVASKRAWRAEPSPVMLPLAAQRSSRKTATRSAIDSRWPSKGAKRLFARMPHLDEGVDDLAQLGVRADYIDH